MDRLPTGITVLDRQLDGGIPTGSIVLLTADPASQSELFLYELSAARETLYLTTIRSEEGVRDAFDRTPTRTGSPHIRSVSGEAALDDANKLVSALPASSNLIVDVLDPLERMDPSRYQRFLQELQTHLVNTESLAVLHGLKGQSIPANRDASEHVADIVFDLQTAIDGNEIVNKLAIPKFRGGTALEEPVKLKLADSVTIDTSRDIA